MHDALARTPKPRSMDACLTPGLCPVTKWSLTVEAWRSTRYKWARHGEAQVPHNHDAVGTAWCAHA
eukprot:6895034-Alexandrium_andersonii.AAC.1